MRRTTAAAAQRAQPTTIGGIPGAPPTARASSLVSRATADPGTETVTITAPFTGLTTAQLPQATDESTRAAFVQARAAQRPWSATDVAERQRFLLRLHELVLRHRNEGLDLVQAESGKTRLDAFDEISATALVAAYYGKHSARLLAPQRAPGALPLLTKATHLRQPRGVVGIISPWNYPLALTAMDVLPALAAGNTVVQKPDNQTALSALWLHELAERAGLPRKTWRIVLGRGSVMGEAIVEEADYVCFTGSTPTGKALASSLAGTLTGYSLELGGKNPMIVLPDADVEKAAAGAVTACFSSAGQLCVSVERIYVHDSIRQRFLTAFAERTRALRLGASLDYRAGMGSLTTAAQLRDVSEHVADARSRGATVLTGGAARPDIGPLFYEPTILTDVPAEAAAFADETFGPVVAVYGYQDIDDAVRRANATPFGLNASVWSRDPREASRVAARLKAGTVNVNEGYAATFGTIGVPMGGMKDSGVGRRNGVDGLLKYTESQSIAVQRGMRLRPARAVPPALWAAALTTGMRVLRRLPGR